MRESDKFLATVGYLYCAAVIFPADQGMAIIMVLALLVVAYVVMINDSE